MTKLVSMVAVAMMVFSACGGAAECTKDSDCKGTQPVETATGKPATPRQRRRSPKAS